MTSRARGVALSIVAAGLITWGATLPLWTMTMKAPQYPRGLQLHVYGTTVTGDLSELAILNHYIGMPPIEAPALETSVFPYGMALLAVLCLAAPWGVWLQRLAVTATALAPIAILLDLQWQLYTFGHSLNPRAPIRLAPFTPLVLGQSSMGNFVSSGMVSSGFLALTGAAMLLVLAGRAGRTRAAVPRQSHGRRIAVAGAVIVATVSTHELAGRTRPERVSSLQALIDTAPRGSIVRVPAGTYRGPIVITGPLTVEAAGPVLIDGLGHGSVVTIVGNDVRFRGFTVRNSGRQVTEEAAGIKVTGHRHQIETNRIEDVYFGIHLNDGSHLVVRDNVIEPGERHGARPGHGISAWRISDSEVSSNRIAHARDGVYLSFTERLLLTRNTVRSCRYGFHSMYSKQATLEDNVAEGNLLGTALMMSDRLVLRRNTVRQHREGAAAYGILLKDIGSLVVEDNEIVSNRIGIYAEAVGTAAGNEAVLQRNVIAGNEVGLALQSTASLIVTGNRIADNLADVRALGRQLSASMQWSRDGIGNYWGQYRGYDGNGDGIGDFPYSLDDAMDALVRRNDSIQAFLYTPAHLSVEAAARLFPLHRQPPVLIDNYPLLRWSGGAR